MYRCVASNPTGSATAAATLSVTGKEPVKLVVKVLCEPEKAPLRTCL